MKMTEEKSDSEAKSGNLLDEDGASDFALDFTTSSSISRVNIKFLIIYIPILWFSGLPVAIYWYEWTRLKLVWTDWITTILFLPFAILCMTYIFVLSCIFFCKLFLVLINLIHKPKEGIFLAEIGDSDFEFWCLRTELKKLALWFTRNVPIPYIDVLAFRWFGLKMDFSSHLNDAWVDTEFINFGRRVMVGQGAVVMSSMVVGKYLIIKEVFMDDYVVIGGQSTVAPGLMIGKDTVLGACTATTFGQVLDPGWIYFGIPAIKLKENKYAESRRDIIIKKDVVKQTKYEESHAVNVDEDKKALINQKMVN